MSLNRLESPGCPANFAEKSSPDQTIEDGIRKNIDFNKEGNGNIALEKFPHFSDHDGR